MKTLTKSLLAIALGASALTSALAQDANPNPQDGNRPPRPQREGGREGRGPGRMMIPPVVKALDVNGDGIVDAAELANASAALKALDKNGDGKLTGEELRPMGPKPGDQAGADQQPPRPAGGPAGRPGMGSPIMAALDVNGDGTIDESELANAPANLKSLDKNADGVLTMDEIHPAGPRGGRPPGGPGAGRPEGGPEGGRRGDRVPPAGAPQPPQQ